MTKSKTKSGTPQDSGRMWEKVWASLFGVKPVKGSGSFWFAKMDVDDGSILWSLKRTENKSFSFTPGLMHEVESAIKEQGFGAQRAGVAIEVDGEQFCILRAEDMVYALTKLEPYRDASKHEAKRHNADVPLLLRGN